MKKKGLVIISLLCSLSLFSQRQGGKLESKIRFGYDIGINYSNLRSRETLPANTEISNSIGFRMGPLMDYTITKYMVFSFRSELSFNKAKAMMTNSDNLKKTNKVLPISLEFLPYMLFRYAKSLMKPYLVLGPAIKYPLSKTGSDYGTKTDIAFDIGVGLESKMRFFIFGFEVRYSFGLLNVNDFPDHASMKFHNVSLLLFFK
jgi:hypothetical protein